MDALGWRCPEAAGQCAGDVIVSVHSVSAVDVCRCNGNTEIRTWVMQACK